MKNIKTIAFSFGIFLCACSSEPKNTELNNTEKSAVEAQIEADQGAMDSLEKAIQAQINGMDSVEETE